MRLVTGLLQEPKTWRTSREPQRLVPTPDEDLFLALRQADQRSIRETDLSQRGVGSRKLSFAPVDHDQVRERLLVGQPPVEVAPNDFVHGGEIIAPFNRFYPELAVLAPLRTSVLEPNGRSHGIGSLRRGDVETNQRARQTLQPELPSELIYGVSCTLLRLHRRELKLLEQMTRVLLRQRDEIAA